MSRVDIRGVIVQNDDKWIYDWFGMDSTAPADVQKAIDEANGGHVDVYINSPGGDIAPGSEIYAMLSQYKKVSIHITGQAHSAASVIAMAGWCEMAPTALMMVHCVSTYASGNHNDFEHTAEVLRTADEAISTAYERKSGMDHGEVIDMMECETWLTAEKALEFGLIDKIMEPEQNTGLQLAAGSGLIPTEKLEEIRNLFALKEKSEAEARERERSMCEARLRFLSLKKEVDYMNLKGYKEQRKALYDKAQELINAGDVDQANEVMEQIDQLDIKFEAIKEAQANLRAMNEPEVKVPEFLMNDVTVPVEDTAGIVISAVDLTDARKEAIMPEKNIDYTAPEYVDVWAKRMMGQDLTGKEYELFQTVNGRKLTNDAHTTSNTSVVIPETVAAGIWQEVADLYPYYADVAKTSVNGIYTLIQGTESTDAAWYEEDTETADGTETFTQYTLSGCELARNIRVSWKLKEMAIEDFIPYIQRRMAERMGAGLANGVVSGAGKAESGAPEPLGIVTALEAQDDTPQVVEYTEGAMTYADFISARALVKSGYAAGLKVYANSATIWTVLANIVDENGRPYFMADPMTGSMRFLGLEVKEDAAFSDGDVLLSNAARGYQINTNKQITVLQQDDNTKRQTIYTGYAIIDGAPLTYLAHALLTPAATA